MGIPVNATQSRNVCDGRHPEDAHSPFHFSNRETGLKGEMTVPRSKAKGSKMTVVYLSNLTSNFMTPAQLCGREGGKDTFLLYPGQEATELDMEQQTGSK